MIEEGDIEKYLSIIKSSKNNEAVTGPAINCSGIEPGNFFIDASCDIRGRRKMRFGNGVIIQKDCWLNIAFDNPDSQIMIDIGEGTNIGRRCTLSAANRIVIGKNVLLGPNVFIADTSHEYRHAAVPIMQQGITSHRESIEIGEGTWIGVNAVIVGNVRIGRHCVIGANSVVNRDLPDYCVAVGSPCRIVKLFDTETGRWKKIDTPETAERYLSKRSSDSFDYLVPFGGLRSLQVEVSSACNLRCPQCFRHIEGHKNGFFRRELWEGRITPVLSQLKDIHLVGIGEPLLCKDLFYFIEDARRNNVTVHTTSNLQLLDKDTAEKLVLSGVQELSFSCDGAEKATYERIRVNGRFEKLKQSLEMINASKRRHRISTPELVLNFGALRSNIHELPRAVEFAKEFHVGRIIAYHDVMYVPELKEESLFHYQELSDRKFAEAKRLADAYQIKMFLPGLFCSPIKYAGKAPYCGYPNAHLYVHSDGRVGPCCMDFPDRYVLGDINEYSLEEVWNSAPILQLRKELSGTPSETCRYCVSHGKMDISDPKFFFRFKGGGDYLRTI